MVETPDVFGKSFGRTQIWQTDGTSAGTVAVDTGEFGTHDNTNIYATDTDVYVVGMTGIAHMDDASATADWSHGLGDGFIGNTKVMGNLFFLASGDEMWRTDGTETGTFLLQDVYPDYSDHLFGLTPVGDELYFVGASAHEPQRTMDLWKTDGSVAGTILVKQYRGGGFADFALVGMGDSLVFWSDAGPALWLTGDSVAGVKKIMDFNRVDADNMLVHNGVFYFIGYENSSSNPALWMRDCRNVRSAEIDAATTHFLADKLVSIYLPLLQTPPFVDACVTEQISS